MRLKHSFTSSAVVLVFEGRSRKMALTILNDQKLKNIWIEPHPSAIHLTIGVEPLDLNKPLENQTDLIDAAMEDARRLLRYATMVLQAADHPPGPI